MVNNMTAEEFYDKINHIIDDARTPDQARQWSEKFFEELEKEYTEYAKEFARIKCLEAIKNVRHKACEIITEKHGYQIDEDNLPFILKSIQNIPNQDVMPEL